MAPQNNAEENSVPRTSNVRVGVVGCGPCGLSFLIALAKAQDKGEAIPQVTVFEKQNDVGGLWNYTWRTGVDEYGEPLPNSQYRYLWSNGPKECLEMSDYSFLEHFEKNIPSFPPRAVLRDYIMGRVKKHQVLNRFDVRVSTVVRNVEPLNNGDRFKITAFNQKSRKTTVEEFDYVITASGHYSYPYLPEINGINDFPGRVTHATDFRDAREYAGQRLLLVGASYSAEDLAMQCIKYGAKKVTCSYRSKKMGFKWPNTIEELPLISHIDDKTVTFKDGSKREVDAIILCTGYKMVFSFLPDMLRLDAPNILYPNYLYKGVIWQDMPKALFMGMQDNYYTFTMFDAQAYYIRDYIMGKITIPSAPERQQDITNWYTRGQATKNCFDDIDFQTEYVKDLMKYSDYPSFDIDLVVKNLYEWERNKVEDILTYREKCFKSPVTGDVGPIHHTTWMQAKDDSLEEFMRNEK